MKCVNEKNLMLYYYQDLPPTQSAHIEKHLKECRQCAQRYGSIQAFCAGLTQEPPRLEANEVNAMVKNVRQRYHTPSLWQRCVQGIEEGFERIRLGVSYKPRLIPAVVVVIVMLSILPFMRPRENALQKEFDILQIELELSLENTEGSLFELYEEDMFLNDEAVGLQSPTLYS